MRLLITGSSGFVGSRLAEYYGKKQEVWAPSHRELDFTDENKVIENIIAFRPDVVIHCGAISDVGACQEDPELSMKVNVEGTRNLARACALSGAKCVFASSDQVYFREKREQESEEAFLQPNREENEVEPLSVYGQHKRLAEKYALEEQPDSVILRLSWMYGPLTKKEEAKGRRNLLTMLTEAVKKQETLSFSDKDYRGVTDIEEVVINMEKAWQLPGGIYNYGSPGSTSIYKTVASVMEALGEKKLVQKANKGDLRNMAMSAHKLMAAGIAFKTSEEALLAALNKVKE